MGGLNCEQVPFVRAKAVELVTGVLDFYRGDLNYKKVCEGYAPGKGSGTTCSFLPHWMLWMLGVSRDNFSKDGKNHKRLLLNRTDGTRGTKMMPSEGVAAIANSTEYVIARLKPDLYPQPGDVVVIQSDPYIQRHEHVFVFLKKISDTLWETGESGQAGETAANGALEAKRKQRVMKISGKKIIAVGGDGTPDRYVHGWLDISQLNYVSGSAPGS